MIVVTRDGHVGEVLEDWLRGRTRLIRLLDGERWHGSKTKGATVNSMTRMARHQTTNTTFSLGRDQTLSLSFLLQLLLNTLNTRVLSILKLN